MRNLWEVMHLGSGRRVLSPLAAFVFALFISFTLPSIASAQYFNSYNVYKKKKKKKYSYKKKKVYKKKKKVRRSTAGTRRVYKKRKRVAKKVAPRLAPDPDNKEPVHVVVSVPKQRGHIYKGGKLVATTRVSTGKRGHDTPSGIYSIIQKNRRHYSNLYNNAPMPYMQRITWSGIALHAGVVPGYPASHGCIRLPYSFAKQLFGYTSMGAHVIVTRHEKGAVPEFISHSALFQPTASSSPYDSQEEASLSDDPSVETITTSSSIQTAATTDLRTDNRFGIPSHIDRLQGRERIKAVQRLLNFLGYKAGRPDGDLGYTTRKAISKFQYDFDMKRTGKVSSEMFHRLYKHANREDIALGRDPNNPEHAEALKKPVRILITRRSEFEKIKDMQRILRFLKYYNGYADGQLGRDTRKAIKKFQYDFMMKQTGVVTDELIDKLYKHANWEVTSGHMYVRQDFKDIFDMPVVIKDADKPLGTHLFTATHFVKGENSPRWLAQTLETRGKKAKKRWNKRKRKYVVVKPAVPGVEITAREALDRVEISTDARKRVEDMLTPGSSLIVADGGWTRETGLGTDFVVQPR